METDCYYCKEKATRMAICNDWGDIPLYNKKDCLTKFKKEAEKIGTQYTIYRIWKIKGNKVFLEEV